MKTKAAIIVWNAFVGLIPILLPLIIDNKDKILKSAKKIKIN
jgi:adenylyl- and sulfurtransferase ThiI